jgi:CubicO group peptidase (beta-lactamase class C family)
MFTAERPWPVVMAERALDLHTLGPPDPVHQPETDAWIAGLGSLPLMAQPGESWLYNTGASVLGVLIQRVTGVPLSEVFASRLFQPLGMHDTTMWTSDVGRLATAYVANANGFEMWDAPDGGWSGPPRFEDGAAGLVSTVDDFLAFARMLLAGGDGIVAPELVAAMTTNQLRSSQGGAGAAPILLGRGWGFCQSVLTEGPRAGSFGWNGGLGTTWLVDPVRSLTVIVMTQRLFSSPDPPQVHVDLQAAAYAALDL